MEPKLQPVSVPGARIPAGRSGAALAPDTSRVLRNTYWLLALSLLPTIGGAIVAADPADQFHDAETGAGVSAAGAFAQADASE